jgi:hypothetical protein
VLALVDQWIAPHNFWLALGHTQAAAPVQDRLPPPWRGHLETSGWRFSLAAAAIGLFAAVLGALGHRSLPLRACSNCGRVVCRRCAQRRRETAQCRECATLETRAQNPDFARVLLKRSQRQAERVRHVTRTLLASVLPGFGLIAFRRAVTPLLILAVAVLLVGPLAGVTLPFEVEPRVGLTDRLAPLSLRVGLGIALYTISIVGYLSCAARDRRRATAEARALADDAEPRPRRWRARAAA